MDRLQMLSPCHQAPGAAPGCHGQELPGRLGQEGQITGVISHQDRRHALPERAGEPRKEGDWAAAGKAC